MGNFLPIIILLNGASSSGKTSIARELQHRSPSPLIYVSLDMFIDMLPDHLVGTQASAADGVQFVHEQGKEGAPITRVNLGPTGKKILSQKPAFAAQLASSGLSLVIDEVLKRDEMLKAYVDALSDCRVYFVGVHCSLEEMERREKARGDRMIGLSRNQINHVHGPPRVYDLEVDTTNRTAADCARDILSFVESEPCPQSFKMMRNSLH